MHPALTFKGSRVIHECWIARDNAKLSKVKISAGGHAIAEDHSFPGEIRTTLYRSIGNKHQAPPAGSVYKHGRLMSTVAESGRKETKVSYSNYEK